MLVDEVRAIARLARLALTDRELESLGADLTVILAHMDALRALDTDGVEPMTHAVAEVRGMRPDQVEPSLDTALALDQAPARESDHFLVPNIIDTNLES